MVSLTAESFDTFMSANWREPRPLRRSERPAPYPVHCLPPIIKEAVREVTGYVKAPEALVAGCALTAISAAIQSRYSVSRDSVLKGPASLYLLTIAASGERKTTVDSLFMAPLREWEARQAKLEKEEQAEYQREMREWERGDHEESERPSPPRVARMLRGDDTSEALARALGEFPVAAVASHEAGAIFGSSSMTPETVMRNLAQVNQLWDGGPIDQGRISRDRVRVDQVRVTMGLQVQPEVLERFSEKNGGLARGIGFFSRFLMCEPESTIGTRYYQPPPAGTPSLKRFQARVAELLLPPAEFDENDELTTRYLDPSTEATEVWINFFDEVEEAVNPDHDYEGIKDVASKAAENASRIACCLHVFAHGAEAPIRAETMRHACSLMRWYLDEAIRFSQKHGETIEIIDAELLEQWLVGHHKKLGQDKAADTLTVNMIRRMGPNRLRSSRPRLDGGLQLLQDYGRIRVQKIPGSKTEYVQIAPRVLAEYSRG